MKTILLIWMLGVNLAIAGDITGTVRAQSKAPAATEGAAGGYDSRKYKFAEKINYDELRDFVVFIEGSFGTNLAPAPAALSVATRRIEQKGAAFYPHVLPLVVGSTVEWPNYDTIFHNVFSMSETKTFDLDIYKGNPPDKQVTFDQAGRVDVFCSIHSSMNCVVLVLENPFFALSDAQGRYCISNVPPGKYSLKAWHERLPARTVQITVPETGEVKQDLTLGLKGAPRN
ncbi:MAG: carboxypeptidase regulatory-like domain-containing protein [Verrucomicrobiota bacterium]